MIAGRESCKHDFEEDVPRSPSRRLKDQFVDVNGTPALVGQRDRVLPHLQTRGPSESLLDLCLRGLRAPSSHILPIYCDQVVAISRPVTTVEPDTSAIELEGSGSALGGGSVQRRIEVGLDGRVVTGCVRPRIRRRVSYQWRRIVN